MPILKKIFKRKKKTTDKLTKADKDYLKKIQTAKTKVRTKTKGVTTTDKKGRLKQTILQKSKHDSKHHKTRHKAVTTTKRGKTKYISVFKEKNKDTGELQVTDSKGRLYTGKKAKRKYKRISKKIKRKTKSIPKMKIKKK